MDMTVNVKEEERNQMVHLAKHVASELPIGSIASFSFVADKITNVIANVSLDAYITSGDNITATAVEAGITAAFPNGLFKIKSEIIYLLMSERTPIDIPSFIFKKKTFVIVFGTFIPSSLRRIASSSSHIHLVRNNDDIAKVSELIKQQTCIDSKYVCDIDMFKENRMYSTCKDCLYACSERQIEVDECPRCPYMRLKPKAQEVNSGPSKDQHVPVEYNKDNKNSFLIATVFSIVTTGVVFTVASVYICYRRQVGCFGQDHDNSISEARGQQIPEGNAIAEVGQEDVPAAANGQDIPLLPCVRAQVDVRNGEEGDMACGGPGQNYINLRHSHTTCGLEETSL